MAESTLIAELVCQICGQRILCPADEHAIHSGTKGNETVHMCEVAALLHMTDLGHDSVAVQYYAGENP